MIGQPPSDDRSSALAPALAAERHARARRIAVGSLALMAGGLAVGAAVAASLDRAGAGPAAVFAFVAVPFVTALVARRRRARISAPLEAGVLLANWLRVEGFVDETGRLLAEADLHKTNAPEAPVRERAIALAAYRAAAERHSAGRDDWLGPFVEAVDGIDLREVQVGMLEHSKRRIPTIAWVVMAPLVVVGTALVAWSLIIRLAYALGLRT